MPRPTAYVASRFHDYERVRSLNDKLAESGWQITHDWTRTDEFGPDGHPCRGDLGEGPLTPDERKHYAALDYFGATEADVLIFYGDLDGYTGALIEVGLTLASGGDVYVIDPSHDSIFWDHPRVTIIKEQELLAYFGIQWEKENE